MKQKYTIPLLLILLRILSHAAVPGQQWYQEAGGASFVSVLVKDASVLYAGTWGDGMYYSRDRGYTWTPMNNDLTNKYIYTILVRKKTLFAGTEGGGVFRCDKRTKRWVSRNGGLQDSVIFSLVENRGVLIAATWKNGMYRSLDGGNTWVPTDGGLKNTVVYALSSNTAGTLYAGTAKQGVFRSDDNGITWRHTGIAGKSILCILPMRNKVWVGTWKSGIYCYDEGTQTWEITALVPGEPVKSFVFKGNRETIYCAKRMMGVYHSDDFGVSCLYAGLAGYDVFSLAAFHDRVVAGTWGNGVFALMDTASTWSNICRTLDGSEKMTLAAQRKQERETVSPVKQVEKINDPLSIPVPRDMKDFSSGQFFSVHTCFPGKLVVCYKVDTDGKVSISLYNYKGELQHTAVTMVTSREKQEISFRTDSLSAGIYYIILQTITDTRTICLVHTKK